MGAAEVRKTLLKMNRMLSTMIMDYGKFSRRQIADKAEELKEIKKNLMNGLPKVMDLDFRTWYDNLEGIDRSLDALIDMGHKKGYYDDQTKAELRTAKRYKEQLENAFHDQHPPNGE